MTEHDSDADHSTRETDADRHIGTSLPVDQLSPTQLKNLRFGLRLFAVYTLFFAGFVLVNAFAPEWSDWKPFGGLNLAILWGFALIVLAFLLAVIYGSVCGSEGTADRESGTRQGIAAQELKS